MRYGSPFNPPNRFEKIHCESGGSRTTWNFGEESGDSTGEPSQRIEFFDDDSRSVVSENKSPDIPFRYSLNPYRGCIHGCAYCYARPTHEYLGWSAGLDFETKILVKRDAPNLFRDYLSRPGWKVEPIVFSGVTDCYQPAERHFRLTRSCLEVALECRQPIGIVTKNALITRDEDILAALAEQRLVHAAISLTTLDRTLAADLEPRTSVPEARLRAIEQLSKAGVPVQVMVAPIIPGLNDSEMAAVLKAARQAGAQAAGYQLLRLPLTVLPIFQHWLERVRPLRAEAVMNAIRGTRGGRLNDSQFGRRMVGQGAVAENIAATFRVFSKKLGYAERLPVRDTSRFRPPRGSDGQMWLFE